jgi:hypothetical protein
LCFVFDMNQCMQKTTETSKESKEPQPRDQMTVSQMEEAKNAEKFLPPRVRFSFCTTGVLGLLAVTHVPQLDAKPSDANAQPNEPQPTPTAEATTPLPALLARPRFAGRTRTARVPGQYPSGTVVVLAGTAAGGAAGRRRRQAERAHPRSRTRRAGGGAPPTGLVLARRTARVPGSTRRVL